MAEVEHSKPDRTLEKSILKTWKGKSTKILNQCSNKLDMYTFPAEKISVSHYQKVTKENLKNIIMMGETGSGKSTLINAFINYAAGIEMEDPLRFKLVNHENESLTREISGYLIEDTFLEYPIMIWDTPEFGDGDEKIKQQIDDLFNIDEFHAICFVINPSVDRLTDTQKIIIDSIQQLFKRKAEMNTYVLARFGDEDCPKDISQSMKSKFPFDENCFFAFNNADLFKSKSERSSAAKQYWDITINSIIRFHNTLAHQLPFRITTETRKAIVKLFRITPDRNIIEKPKRTIFDEFVNKSTKIVKECIRGLDIYAFPAKKTSISEYKQSSSKNLRKIIIMGETGTGKSTLLNAFVNYAAGVEMDDPLRFKLVIDEVDSAGDQSISQTTDISGYLIEDTLLGYDIQIWDTPGFGNTQGIERDEMIKEQINELLKIEDECHAVCFVVKDNVNRLTDIQKYIIDRVLLFFGKEAKENIYLLATFGDGNRPEMLSALEKSNFPFDENRWFAFNNKDLFKNPSQRTECTKMYWEYTIDSIGKFFRDVDHQHAFSLTTTKAVIGDREKLKMNINAITSELDEALEIKKNSKENLMKLKAVKSKVENMEQFKKKVTAHTKVPVPTKNITTFCRKCTHTCHENCSIPNNSDKAGCWAMTDGYCRICPKGCKWDWHSNEPIIYKDEIVESEEFVKDDDKQLFDDATKELSICDKERVELERETAKAQENINKLLRQIKDQIQSLKNTAIQNYSLDMYKYFTTISEAEAKRGNQQKAIQYEKIAKQEQIQLQSESLTAESMMELAPSKIL
ncbi:hypothetical protein LOD99_1373 [Oopsacas minuta]|uniref:AAA+ ATPase domain-containing protein n=1 Tax=Oopsacas minuta TaxID=111878 RepID=A0AAV7K5Z3_9METZ|nr:hypothetical protein LOD99_1373 [Oopsacas minuta]